jgi:hypothetical protein
MVVARPDDGVVVLDAQMLATGHCTRVTQAASRMKRKLLRRENKDE